MWQGRNVKVHVYTQQGLAYAAKKMMMMMVMVIAKHRNERYTEYWNEFVRGSLSGLSLSKCQINGGGGGGFQWIPFFW